MEEAITHYRQALTAQPDDAQAHYQLAVALLTRNEVEETSRHYREAVRLEPNAPLYLNDLAWLLATTPADDTRNGDEAVRLAQEACRLGGGNVPRFWGTLDAAYAAAGRFDDAVATATKTRQLALAAGQPDIAQAAEERLTLYRARKPYQPRPSPPTAP